MNKCQLCKNSVKGHHYFRIFCLFAFYKVYYCLNCKDRLTKNILYNYGFLIPCMGKPIKNRAGIARYESFVKANSNRTPSLNG